MQTPGEVERMSLTARLLNVVVAPGELFEALARAPFAVSNWLVPAALVGLVGIVCQLIVFAQPAMAQQIRDMQDQAIQAKVDAGEMKQADADKAKEMMGGIGLTIAKVAGGGGDGGDGGGGAAVVGIPGVAGRRAGCSGRRWPYWRGVEVAGLGALIGMLGMLVGTFLAVGLGKLFARAARGVAGEGVRCPEPRPSRARGAEPVFAVVPGGWWRWGPPGSSRVRRDRWRWCCSGCGWVTRGLAVLFKLSWLAF
jgi:hypothetical protein